MLRTVLCLVLPAACLLAGLDAASPAAAAAVPVPVTTPAAGLDAVPWTAKADCPMISERPGGCSDEHHFYILGGHDENNITRRSVYRFDPVANSWDSVAQMLTAVDNNGACWSPHWNRIFVVGGYSPPTAALQVYDVVADSWYYGADAPFVDYGAAAVALDGLIYVLWGSGNNGAFASYHPQGDSWHMLAGCPGATSHAAMCVWDGKVYASGGWSDNAMFRRYDPVANSWTALTNLPQGRHGHGMDAFDGVIYVYGGGQLWATPTANCYAWHTDGDSWSSEGPMQFSHIAGAFGGVPGPPGFLLHAAAGYNGTSRINSTEQGEVEGGGGVSPDSLYFKAHTGTALMSAAKSADPYPANRTAMSFQNAQSVPDMDPRGEWVFEVNSGTMRRFSTETGAYTDHNLGVATGHRCATDGNFVYVPDQSANRVHKFTLDGTFINSTDIDRVIDSYSFAWANDTVWVSPNRYNEVFYGYPAAKFNGGSITADATWAVDSGTNGTGNLCWDGAHYFLCWIGTSPITFKVFGPDRSLADSGEVHIDPRSVMCRSMPPPPWRDAAVHSITSPPAEVDSGVPVTPTARTFNFGSVPLTYNVRFRIGGLYDETILVANHPPGALNDCYFPNWTPTQVGTFALSCSTMLAGDAWTANDVLRDSVLVRPGTGMEGPGRLAWTAFCEVAPNPASGRCRVRFGLPGPGRYSLRLHDATGRLAAVVGAGEAQALMPEATVARSEFGLAPGAYILRLESRSYCTTRKLLLE